MTTDHRTRRQTFRDLHASGTFVMPNPFDIGSAKLLASMGFSALATTSSGFAATLGRMDMQATLDEVVAHTAALGAHTSLPLNVDSERCYADDAEGITHTVNLLAAAGAAGFSIEDWDPVSRTMDDRAFSVDRVAAAASAAAAHGLVMTARCENLLRGIDDLDDTIARLCAYRDAGAEVVYAPGLTDLDSIRRVVEATGVPVNVLLLPGGPTVGQLASVGVRRISIGSGFSNVAYGAMVAAAELVLRNGTLTADAPTLSSTTKAAAFSPVETQGG